MVSLSVWPRVIISTVHRMSVMGLMGNTWRTWYCLMVCKSVKESFPPERQTKTRSPFLIIAYCSTASRKGLKMSLPGGRQRLRTANGLGGSVLWPFGKMHISIPFSTIQLGPWTSSGSCWVATLVNLFVVKFFSNQFFKTNGFVCPNLVASKLVLSPRYDPISVFATLSLLRGYDFGVNGGCRFVMTLFGVNKTSLTSEGKTIQRSWESWGSTNRRLYTVWKIMFNILNISSENLIEH